MTLFSKILVGFALVGASVAHAKTDAYACNACTPAQADALALSKASRYGHTPTMIVVYDLKTVGPNGKTGIGRNYNASMDTNMVTHVDYPVAIYTGAATFTQFTTIQDYSKLYFYSGQTENLKSQFRINIPSPISTNPDGTYHDNGSVNAFDVLQISATDHSVSQCLATYSCNFTITGAQPALNSDMYSIFTTLKSSIMDFSGLTCVIEVVFPDGSSIKYSFDKTRAEWVRIPNSAHDSHGNLLPETRPNGSQTYVGGDGGQHYDMRNIAIIIGVPYQGHDTGSGSGGGCRFERWNGQTLDCIL
jgi:hypothetical protein